MNKFNTEAIVRIIGLRGNEGIIAIKGLVVRRELKSLTLAV